MGVDIFFVLSGFLITYRYYDSFQLKRKYILNYIINRLARIYPAFFLFTILTYVVSLSQSIPSSTFSTLAILKHTLFELFMNLTFLKGFFYDLRFIGIPQGWTLTVEECFYFLAPLVFFFSKKVNLFLIPLFFLLIGFFIVYFLGNKLPYGFFIDNRFMLMFTFLGKSFEFFIGMWLALKYRNKNLKFSKKNSTTLISVITFPIFLLIISYSRKQDLTGLTPIILINFLLPFCIALLFIGLLTEKTILSKILSGKLFSILGKSSYIFYLIHMGVIQLFIAKNLTENLLVNFLILNILSILIFKYFEQPLNQKIRLWYQSRI